jgi:CBS domain-containing protein
MFKVKDIMIQPVVSVNPDMPIYDAIRLLASRNVSGLPVVDADLRLVGLLSEKDVLSLLYQNQDPSQKTVEEYMSKSVVSFDVNDNVVALCDCLEHNAFRRIPITQNGRLTGIVSRSDVIRIILSLRHEGTDQEEALPLGEEDLVPYSPGVR